MPKTLRIIGISIAAINYPVTFIKYASARGNGYHIMDFILMITFRHLEDAEDAYNLHREKGSIIFIFPNKRHLQIITFNNRSAWTMKLTVKKKNDSNLTSIGLISTLQWEKACKKATKIFILQSSVTFTTCMWRYYGQPIVDAVSELSPIT